jgi:phage-related tail fiber protein
VSFNSYKLTNLATPTNDSDAANKAYVDAARSGLDVKQSVRAATTANITLSGTQTIDGVALIAGDRVLVKDQSTASQNGIYVVAAGAWSRATDADTSTEVTPGMFTFIEEGSVNSDQGWVLATNGAITLGTTSLTFAQFSGAGSFAVDTTLSKSGNTIGLASGVATAGTYKSVTVDTYGRITAGTNPTTLSGYGITDAQSQITSTGLLKGAGAGSVSAAVAGTDYLSPSSDIDGGSYP